MGISLFFFWLSVVVITYVYLGYPLLIFGLAHLFRTTPDSLPSNYRLPPVILIITAHNEAKIIREKLENSLSLDYPKNLLRIVVVSDGCTDQTNPIVEEYQKKGIRLLALSPQRGKTYSQNQAVQETKLDAPIGDIIVFSDANAFYEPAAIRHLVAPFANPKVGGVCGELRYRSGGGTASSGEGLYWRYEQFLKNQESRFHSVIGANGSIYALRRELYQELSPDIISDLVEPLTVVESGYRFLYQSEAVSWEEFPANNLEKEFRRKVRILVRSYRAIGSYRRLLNPLRYAFLSFSLWSHKILRWGVFLFLGIIFLANLSLFGHSQFFLVTFTSQVLFYIINIYAFVRRRKGKELSKVLNIAFYFMLVNAAAGWAFWTSLRGEKEIYWQPQR